MTIALRAALATVALAGCQSQPNRAPIDRARLATPIAVTAPIVATAPPDASPEAARPHVARKRSAIKPPRHGKKLPCGATICDGEGNCTAASPPNCY